jgi:small-conductance mechanosensitive channel
MRAEAKWQAVIRDDLDIAGVERFADSGVTLRVRIKTAPMARWNVLREMNRRIKQRFDELGIEIPYPYQRLVMDSGDKRFPPPPKMVENATAEDVELPGQDNAPATT